MCVTQGEFRGFLSNLGRFEGRRQLPRRMKNNKAKDAKDGNTQKRENRAYYLAAERLRPSKNPPEARLREMWHQLRTTRSWPKEHLG